MKRKILLVLGLGFALILGSLLKFSFATEDYDAGDIGEEKTQEVTGVFTGTVDSYSSTEIIVSNKGNSAKFKIDAKTQIQGKLVTGAKVTVTYRNVKIFKAHFIKKAMVIKVMEEKKEKKGKAVK